MADTPRLWVECEHGEGDDHLHYGDRSVRRVPAGALLIEDPKRLTAELTAEIARIIHDEYHWQTDGIITPECVDLSGHAAEAIVARLRAAGEGER